MPRKFSAYYSDEWVTQSSLKGAWLNLTFVCMANEVFDQTANFCHLLPPHGQRCCCDIGFTRLHAFSLLLDIMLQKSVKGLLCRVKRAFSKFLLRLLILSDNWKIEPNLLMNDKIGRCLHIMECSDGIRMSKGWPIKRVPAVWGHTPVQKKSRICVEILTLLKILEMIIFLWKGTYRALHHILSTIGASLWGTFVAFLPESTSDGIRKVFFWNSLKQQF